jgi:hypothetical protein
MEHVWPTEMVTTVSEACVLLPALNKTNLLDSASAIFFLEARPMEHFVLGAHTTKTDISAEQAASRC